VAAGGDATFFAAVTGTMPMTFRWLRSGTAFTNGIIINTATNTTLIVTNVPPNYDGSQFRAAARNIVTESGSVSARLTVFGPPVITQQPAAQTTPLGGNATFTAAASGVAPLVYQWWFQQAPLTGKTNSTLNLTNVQALHTGFYSVTVTNRDGFASSLPALLRLTDQAVLREPAALAEGGFRLVIEGTPNLTYAIEISSDLQSWDTLTTRECTDGWLIFTDLTVTNGPQRFYRARPVTP
jgi:hypothetical protein